MSRSGSQHHMPPSKVAAHCSHSTSRSSCSCGPLLPSRPSHAAAQSSAAAGTAAPPLRPVAAPATAAAAPPAAAARAPACRHSAPSDGGLLPPAAGQWPPARRVPPLPPPPGRRRRSLPQVTATPAAHCCGPAASVIHADPSWLRCSQGWERERAWQGEGQPCQPQAANVGAGEPWGVSNRSADNGQASAGRLTQALCKHFMLRAGLCRKGAAGPLIA